MAGNISESLLFIYLLISDKRVYNVQRVRDSRVKLIQLVESDCFICKITAIINGIISPTTHRHSHFGGDFVIQFCALLKDKFSVAKSDSTSTNVCSFVHLSVSPPESKTPKQHKIHFT